MEPQIKSVMVSLCRNLKLKFQLYSNCLHFTSLQNNVNNNCHPINPNFHIKFYLFCRNYIFRLITNTVFSFFINQGGDICRFNFESNLPHGVRAGFALFEDLGTVDLCRVTNKDSLIGERIPCKSIFVTGNLHHV